MNVKSAGIGPAKYLYLSAIVIIPLILVACHVTREVAPVWQSPLPLPLETLGPGDELEVNFVNWPDLNVTQRIRSNGCVSL